VPVSGRSQHVDHAHVCERGRMLGSSSSVVGTCAITSAWIHDGNAKGVKGLSLEKNWDRSAYVWEIEGTMIVELEGEILLTPSETGTNMHIQNGPIEAINIR
jgi:hypothetical protein